MLATRLDSPQPSAQIGVNLIAGALGVIVVAAVHLALSRGNHSEIFPDPGRWCPRGPDRMRRHRTRIPWVAAARIAAGDAWNPGSPAVP